MFINITVEKLSKELNITLDEKYFHTINLYDDLTKELTKKENLKNFRISMIKDDVIKFYSNDYDLALDENNETEIYLYKVEKLYLGIKYFTKSQKEISILDENHRSLIYAQSEISKKDLIEVLNSCSDDETFIINYLKNGLGTEIKILNDIIAIKLSEKSNILYKE